MPLCLRTQMWLLLGLPQLAKLKHRFLWISMLKKTWDLTGDIMGMELGYDENIRGYVYIYNI